jgi:peptidoglycan/LPS O-acetylase OafA/YrhL
MQAPQYGRNAALDGLRGVAILLVLLSHFGGAVSLTKWGWVGVDLFFVLSGFLITGILLDAEGAEGVLRSFYIRRVLRIWPLYLSALVVILVLLPATGVLEPITVARLRDAAPWFWGHLSNIYFLHHRDPFRTEHLWSLAVEEQFYLLWPLLVVGLGRRRLGFALVALALTAITLRLVLVLVGHADRPWAFQLPARMDGLLVGAWLAWKRHGSSRVAGWPAWWWGGGAAIASVLIGGTSRDIRFVSQLPFITLFFGALVVLAVDGALPWLTSRPLRLLGLYSYGLYIIHFPLLGVMERLGWLPRNLISWGERMIVGVVLSGALAWVSWRYLEEPCLRLKRFVPMPGRTGEVMIPAPIPSTASTD